jgi:hypothetical protein
MTQRKPELRSSLDDTITALKTALYDLEPPSFYEQASNAFTAAATYFYNLLPAMR